MNKTSKSFASLLAATAVAAGGIALAQSPAATTSPDVPPKSSTPGAGCTATGNAMSAGNLGGTPTNRECNPAATPAAAAAAPAAAPAAAATTTEPAPSPSASANTSPSPPVASTAPAPATASAAPPQRVARADRG